MAVGVAVAAGFVAVAEGTAVLVAVAEGTAGVVGVGLGPPPPATVAAVEGVVIFVSLKSASVYACEAKTI